MTVRRLTAAALALAFPLAHAAETPCSPSPADRAWLEAALRHWPVVERDALRLPAQPLPKIVAADASCTSTGVQRADGTMAWTSAAHGELVRLPDGKEVPVGPFAFAAPDEGGHAAYFTMSLPSVWRSRGVQSALGLETLMDGVLLHELAHTRQSPAMTALLAEATRRYGLPEDIGDDSLQEAFSTDPEYVKAYEAERDLLFAAADAPDDGEARRLAAQALAAHRARQARWFVGANEKWRTVDDVFLTMEGVGQYVIHWWFTSPRGLHLDAATARCEVRRKRKFWTQDEGLALFLVVDRLLPGWQQLAFAPEPELAPDLLARAAGQR